MSFKVLLSCAVLGVLAATASAEDSRKLISFDPEIAKKLRAILQTCQTENGVGEEAVDVIRAGEVKDEQSFKNFVYCAYKNFGAFDENGHVVSKVAAGPFPQDLNIESVIENCKHEGGKNPVDDFFEVFKCFQKTSPVRMQLY